MGQLLLVAIACPLCLLAGILCGAWMQYRSHRQMSPIPDVGAALKSVVEVVLRRKKEPAKSPLKFPSMKA